MECPYRKMFKQEENEVETTDKANTAASNGRYVPPNLRGGDLRLGIGNIFKYQLFTLHCKF